MADLSSLLPWQVDAHKWLHDRDRACLWDEAGLGKTRSLLSVCNDKTLVVTTGAIRDTEVWQNERKIIGLDLPDFEVISYHALGRMKPADMKRWKDGIVIYDESHRLKEREKPAWGRPAQWLSKQVGAVYEATGTPMPNAAHELWAQLRLIDTDNPAYDSFWRWADASEGGWFQVTKSRFDPTGHGKDIGDRLWGCMCTESEMLKCEHWRTFAHAMKLDELALRRLREDVWKDAPPMIGQDTPFWCKMTTNQRKAYNEVKKQFFSEIDSIAVDGKIWIEAMNDGEKYSILRRLATGVSSLGEKYLGQDPAPLDKESGKLATFAEQLEQRSKQEFTLVGVHLHDTAAAVMRLLDKMGLTWTTFSGRDSGKQRRDHVRDFQDGRYNVMIGSVMAIKEGITLTRADECHLIERPTSPGDMEQVIRRIHRIGQTRPVTVRQYLTEKSPDEVNWEVLWRRDRRGRAVLSVAELKKLL